MFLDGSELRIAATDLANHLACRRLTELDGLVAHGRLERPAWRDPMAAVLEERGLAHEQGYLDYLRNECGLELVEIPGGPGVSRVGYEATLEAMDAGAEAIVQATLIGGCWHGRADVLLRVERPSALGGWSYVPADTKLAAETRSGTVLQLCLYADLLRTAQGALPEEMRVVAPGRHADPERLRTLDFFAYYRLVRRQLEVAIQEVPAESAVYPEPVDHCQVCRWWQGCDRRRREDDHLSLVAGATRLQRRELEGIGIGSVRALAEASLPLEPRPARGSPESYERIHHQARLQVESRSAPTPVFEELEPVQAGLGLARLPEPSPGDVFLDLEGDPFVEGGGREYLFGWVVRGSDGEPEYRARWGLDAAAERESFEAFIDEVMAGWQAQPDLHVYHFHSYEPAALKRLMGRYATREDELDRLLRAGRFVDLHAVVREGLRIGIERYGLKELEAVHGFERELDLREASNHLRVVERGLELNQPDAIPAESREAVLSYNRDDCVSTWHLREWLEAVRAGLAGRGISVPRPEERAGDPPEELDERRHRLLEIFERLTRGVAPDPAERTPEEQARWLLAHLLEWHRREDKATWWEYFRLRELSEDDLREERKGLAGLRLEGRVGGTDPAPVHRYRFPDQDQDVRPGDVLREPGSENAIGEVVSVDAGARTIDLKKRVAARDLHPGSVWAHSRVPPGVLPDALERLGLHVAEQGIEGPGRFQAERDLLLREPPRVAGSGGVLVRQGEELLDAARRLVLELEEGILPVQGPPGSGKTYMGARMICSLVRAGRKVGITAVSHKVIRNLIDAVFEAAAEEGLELNAIQKVSDRSDCTPPNLTETKGNRDVYAALANGAAQVGAGTAWLWAREEAAGELDVLIVDEAGQMSLANVLAVSQAARSVVLLGDPQQLEQPIQGGHPEGAEVSALEHLLAEHDTLPDDRGLFLKETWRLHPAICQLTSELFYEERLAPRAGRERQAITGPTPFAGAGLWLASVEHAGNRNSSAEEVACVAAVVDSLMVEGVGWIDAEGGSHPLGWDDLLIVSPYNAQVAALKKRLPDARVGTVDKFQGQQAPVVIYSMATSSPEEAPRGMEFLYSLNRLNVATSRALCTCVLVASPRLFEPECRTPHQMRLANALCRYAELARRHS